MKVKCTFLKNLSLIQICGLPGLSTDSGVQAGVVPEAVEPAGTLPTSHLPEFRHKVNLTPGGCCGNITHCLSKTKNTSLLVIHSLVSAAKTKYFFLEKHIK
jgi:hypothetical protein